MKSSCDLENGLQTVISIPRTIDIITAFLLLTGQVTVVRLIIEPGGFALSVGGPLTGRARNRT
ncbi:hypothetical protein [Bacillus sp. ISL-7]|uniref:hypothetical protein n=1 Tax=Bacillus sp. ISL-7 TaxID=2819136 RepID=UPI001BE813B8|nr:hypothetical protein [Bacillus sp. ISL-7]MBT2736366.1 hypothetical protein [Bacillus sp. ISL-7]